MTWLSTPRIRASLAISSLALSLGHAVAHADQGGEGRLAPAQLSQYREAFGGVRGAETSLDMRGADPSTVAALMLGDFEASRLEAALEKNQELIAKLRNGPAAELRKVELAAALDFRGVIRQRQGRYNEAVVSHADAVQILESLREFKGPEKLAARNNLAVAKYLLGEFDASESLLTVLVNDAALEPVDRARARNNRGLIEAETGRIDAALVDFANAESDARNADAPLLLAQILNNEARVWMARKNRPRAEQMLAEAVELAGQADAQALKANVLDSWAEMLLQFGAFEAALAKADAASALEAKVSAPLLRATILKNRGRALAGLKRLPEAGKAYADALALADQMGLPALRRDILTARARLKAQSGDVDGAIEDYTEIIALVEETRERLKGESESAFIKFTSQLYREIVTLLAQRKKAGDAEKALSFVERSQSAALQEQMVQQMPPLRDAVARRDIEGTRGVLRQEAALAREIQTRIEAGADVAEIKQLRQRLTTVRQEALRALAELNSKYKGRYDRFVPAAVDPKWFRTVRPLLPKRSAMVAFAYSDDSLYYFMLSSDGTVQFRQNGGIGKVELERRIAEYRDLVINSGGKAREDWRIDSWATEKWTPLRDATVGLHAQILQPIADWIDAADHVIFAPTGQLYYLPLHALGSFDAASGQIDFLALKKRVSYLAAGSLLGGADKAPPRPPGRTPRVLALGDVRFADHLKALPYSKTEVEEIRKIYGPTSVVLAGPQATKERLLAALRTDAPRRGAAPVKSGGFDFVLLSTHGILDARHPQDSHLALEGGNSLKAAEIAGLNLQGTELVTLSACETGLGDESPGADLASLGEYVAIAGAASVVVSLWSVDDLETARLMKELYSQLKSKPAEKVEALARAQLSLASRPESRHPFFWAPFILYGRGW